MNIRQLFATAITLGLIAGVANAQAPLLPGNNVAPPPTLAQGAPVGTQIQVGSVAYSETAGNGASIAGNIYFAVYDRDPGVTTLLDYYYQVEVTSSAGGGTVSNFGISSFLGFDTNVAQIAINPGIAGFGAGNSNIIISSRTGSGAGIDNLLGQEVLSGRTNTFLVQTNASTSQSGSLSAGGGGVSAFRTVPAPVAGGVQGPEPASLALIALGTVAFGAVARRRK